VLEGLRNKTIVKREEKRGAGKVQTGEELTLSNDERNLVSSGGEGVIYGNNKKAGELSVSNLQTCNLLQGWYQRGCEEGGSMEGKTEKKRGWSLK